MTTAHRRARDALSLRSAQLQRLLPLATDDRAHALVGLAGDLAHLRDGVEDRLGDDVDEQLVARAWRPAGVREPRRQHQGDDAPDDTPHRGRDRVQPGIARGASRHRRSPPRQASPPGRDLSSDERTIADLEGAPKRSRAAPEGRAATVRVANGAVVCQRTQSITIALKRGAPVTSTPDTSAAAFAARWRENARRENALRRCQ